MADAFERAAVRSFDRAVLRSFIRNTRLRSCADLREGPAIFDGRALTSPVCGIVAACYLLRVDATLRDGSARHKVISGMEPFEVSDGQGRILVEPKHALLALARQYQQGGDDQPATSTEVLRLLRGEGAHWVSEITSFTWRESFLEPGERCLVCGSLKVLSYAEGQHRGETVFRPRLVAPERLPLVIADQSREEVLDALLSAEQRMPEG